MNADPSLPECQLVVPVLGDVCSLPLLHPHAPTWAPVSLLAVPSCDGFSSEPEPLGGQLHASDDSPLIRFVFLSERCIVVTIQL